MALAFVPERDVVRAWEALINMPGKSEFFNGTLVDYMEKTFIGTPNRNRPRKQPLFPVKLWNCWDQLKGGLPRTTNSVEAWHRAFQQIVASCHPEVYKFFEILKNEQGHQEVLLEQVGRGVAQPKKKEM